MKKTAIICLIAMMALVVMGFGFAKWSDTVTIGAAVATGNVATTITNLGTNDNGSDPNVEPGNNAEGKDVGSITVNQVDEKTLSVAIANGYPYYAPAFTFKVTSTGSVPVKIEEITGPGWSGNLADYIKVASWSFTVHNPASNGLGEYNKTQSSNGPTNWDDLVAAIGHQQLHQNGYIDVTVQFYIDEEVNGELAPMNGSASGTITINTAQWNEVS